MRGSSDSERPLILVEMERLLWRQDSEHSGAIRASPEPYAEKAGWGQGREPMWEGCLHDQMV